MNTKTSNSHGGNNDVERADDAPLHTIDVDTVVPDHSLRTIGVDRQHVRALAECYELLPPILVHRSTMTVIDGNHRLMAAKLLGKRIITAHFFDGDADAALAAALQANFSHGLPLSLADRTRAASRLMVAHPDWSDRRVAATVGLSPKTAGAVRKRASEEIPQTRERVGRDGRRRRMPISERRRRAAKETDAATATELVSRLSRDPSMRQSEQGRFLLRMLDVHLRETQKWDALATTIPPHRAASIAHLAMECARVWASFSESVAPDANNVKSAVDPN